MKYVVTAALAALIATQTGCGSAGADVGQSLLAPELAQGEYGPKSWRTAQAEFCTESGGVWSCAPTGGVSPAACSGANLVGPVFHVRAGYQVQNTYGTELYEYRNGTITWLTSGVSLDLETLPSGDLILTMQAGCSMLYERL